MLFPRQKSKPQHFISASQMLIFQVKPTYNSDVNFLRQIFLFRNISVTKVTIKLCSKLCRNFPMYRKLYCPVLPGQALSPLSSSLSIKDNSAWRSGCTQVLMPSFLLVCSCYPVQCSTAKVLTSHWAQSAAVLIQPSQYDREVILLSQWWTWRVMYTITVTTMLLCATGAKAHSSWDGFSSFTLSFPALSQTRCGSQAAVHRTMVHRTIKFEKDL